MVGRPTKRRETEHQQNQQFGGDETVYG